MSEKADIKGGASVAMGLDVVKPKRPEPRERELVFVDIETTGLDPYKHEIIEIAAVRLSSFVDGHREIGRFEAKAEPKRIQDASPEALKINGYTPEKWANAIKLRDALEGFFCLLNGGSPTIAGHNASAFDVPYIKAAIAKEGGMSWPRSVDYHVLDTCSMFWPIATVHKLPGVKLENACDYFGVSNEGAHGAMRDVERAIAVYKRIMGMVTR